MWYVYIVRCSDGTLYTGSTTDLKRRIKEHNESKTAAKYTRGRRPVKLVYQEKCTNKSSALKREEGIKKLTREEKRLPPKERQALIKERTKAMQADLGKVEMLFNLREDMGEQQNRIDQHPEIAERLKKKMEAFYQELSENRRSAGTGE